MTESGEKSIEKGKETEGGMDKKSKVNTEGIE